ncbi:hypothetical protein [Neobacillus drentensis]|uniref:hypothetical protein n=1 Tax=Neobacillus drentensis TaxID=220684 RepID=UPI0030034315
MLPLIWVFSSVIILMSIILVIPLGFTVKGKLFTVLASFLLGLGGLVASSSFPLWETALILVALIFFTAYFMDKRIGTELFKEFPSNEEELRDELIFSHSDLQMDLETLPDSLDHSEVKVLERTLSNLTDSSDFLTMHGLEKVIENENTLQDDDISFLLERNLEVKVNEHFAEIESEIGYLSDIESLLVEASIDQIKDQIDHLKEIDDRTTIIHGKNDFNQHNSVEDDLIEDSTFDFLLIPKELAVSKADVLKEIGSMKKISLQK